jgi:hypothetical protein
VPLQPFAQQAEVFARSIGRFPHEPKIEKGPRLGMTPRSASLAFAREISAPSCPRPPIPGRGEPTPKDRHNHSACSCPVRFWRAFTKSVYIRRVNSE